MREGRIHSSRLTVSTPEAIGPLLSTLVQYELGRPRRRTPILPGEIDSSTIQGFDRWIRL
jgi:hypothetical protein